MWHTDPAAEQLMASLNMKYEVRKSIPINKLRLKESKEINSRCGDPVDELVVEQYAFHMAHGVRFPMPVLTDNYIIAAGNQRISAAVKAGIKAIDAYVIVGADAKQIDDFIRRDNIRHGQGLDEQQKVQTCVELHRKYKTPIKELNDKYFGGNTKTYNLICVANRAKEVEEKVQSRGVAVTRLANSTLAAFHPISENINVLKAAVALAQNYSFSSISADELVKSVQSKTTESERLSAIRDASVALEQKTTTGTVHPEVQLRRELIRLQKFLATGFDGKPMPPIDSFATSDNTRKELREIATDVTNHIKRLKEKVK